MNKATIKTPILPIEIVLNAAQLGQIKGGGGSNDPNSTGDKRRRRTGN